jgi:hypothetical protein
MKIGYKINDYTENKYIMTFVGTNKIVWIDNYDS